MPLSRLSTTALALACSALACTPSVPNTPAPTSVTTALFNPTAGQLPLPNDLLLAQTPAALAASGLPAAEVELIGVFQSAHGFPNDQEVAVTVDFAQNNIDPNTGAVTSVAPDLDLTTFTPSTYFMVAQTGSTVGAGTIQLAPIAAGDYVKYPDCAVGSTTQCGYGELTLHNQGHQPWVPGEYSLFIRGGQYGVKTTAGDPVYASSVFYLIEQGQDLTLPQNIGLLEAQLGSLAAAEAAARQLNQIIAAYELPFAVCDTVFPHQELAVLDTFAIAPLVTQVELDPNRGLVPLPIDLLRDPVAGGTLTPQGSCALASGTFEADGGCVTSSGAIDAAAAGFATLDGFSTTGAILAPTSALLDATTITPSTVMLFDLTNPAAPALVDPTTYITEPSEIQSEGFSPVIGLQPAGATAGDATSIFRTRPLKDATDYAVVITNGVLDKSHAPLGRGTTASVLLFTNPLVDSSGHSQLTGIPDATAGALEVMREQLIPVLSAANAKGVSASQIAMAYTFHTETILSTATQLAALPYLPACSSTVTTNCLPPAANAALAGPATAIVNETPAAAFNEYGVDVTLAPSSHIHEILETNIVTLNLLDPASGAFLSNPANAAAEVIKVLIATPLQSNANLTACPGALGAAPPNGFGLKCAPMVVFRHGLGGGRADMLTLADSFAAKGMVVVAIDAAKHGDRSFCATNADCATGDTCQAIPSMETEGDPAGATPGQCVTSSGAAGAFATHPVLCPSGQAQCSSPTDGIPNASSNFLISSNFFRTRDTFRQDIIDESQLVHALAFVPSGAPGNSGNALYDYMGAQGVIVDPSRVYFVGQSLGSIQGTADVAANPRISKAVFNVGGGTVVDVFTNSPSFKTNVDELLLSLGIVPGTSAYLQFLIVAKMILDPADPINFAGHLTADTLPNLLASPVAAQAPKAVLSQVAYCDQVVPNPFEYLLDANIPTGPLPGFPGFVPPGVPNTPESTGTFEIFVAGETNLQDCPVFGGAPLPASAVNHGFITDWTPITSQATGAANLLTGEAQADAAAFLSSGTLPPSVQVPQAP